MALRAVPDHPKFAHLKSLLSRLKTRLRPEPEKEPPFPKAYAVGLLETLWHFTGKYTPQGNIGKYSDGQIEAWLEWDGERGELITALVRSGWLDDVGGAHRLLVHDWHQHADKATRQALKRAKLHFIMPTLPDVDTPFPNQGTPWTHRAQVEEQSGHTVPDLENTVDTPCPESGTVFPESSTAWGLPVPVPVPVPGAGADNAPPDTETLLDGQPMLNLARWLLEECAIPVTFQTQQSASAGIGAFAREHSMANHRAAIALAKLARDALNREETVDRWWFEDAKWRRGKGNGARDGSYHTRTDRNREAARQAIADIAGHHADGAGGDEAGDSQPGNAEGLRQTPCIIPPARREGGAGAGR